MSLPLNLGTPGTPGTPETPETSFTASGELNGRGIHGNPNLAGLPEDPKTREQILRERYMKGLKKRKCTVCGNTARARCPFRACKTCCSRARNACSVHVLKSNTKSKPEGTIVHPSYNAPPSGHAEQPWLAATLQASMGGSYLRPGYSVPTPYNIPTPMGLGIGHPTPVDTSAAAKTYAATSSAGRPWVGSSIMEQHEAQRMKSLRIATQKEAYMTNTWRLNRYKEYMASEISAEDDAFDRYVSNSSLLEEVFTLNAGPLKGLAAVSQLFRTDGKSSVEDVESRIDESILMDAMRNRLAANSKRKEASRQKLKHVIDKALLRLRNPGQDSSEAIVEDDESVPTGGMPVTSWPSKRSKPQTEDRKRSLKRTEAFDMLIQKLSNAKDQESLHECVELYKSILGHDLSDLLPDLSSNQGASSCTRNSENGTDTADGIHASLSASELISRSVAPHGGDDAELDMGGTLFSSNNGDEEESAKEVEMTESSVSVQGATPVNMTNWNAGVENLERDRWLRELSRGLGYWKVLASEDTIYRMCVEAEKTCSSVQQL